MPGGLEAWQSDLEVKDQKKLVEIFCCPSNFFWGGIFLLGPAAIYVICIGYDVSRITDT